MIEHQASSIGELVQAAGAISRAWKSEPVDPEELWFRGQKRRDQSLLPGLYRPNNAKYHYDEVGLFELFRILAAPHVRGQTLSDWDWYFLAQHHKLPTRLLDWTENLLAATYFAVCEAIYCGDRLAIDDQLTAGRQPPKFDDSSPVIWVLDAGTLNQAACGEDMAFVVGREYTGRYLPDAVSTHVDDNRKPLAIIPPHSIERVAAQQGRFTVHGHAREGLEVIAAAEGVKLARVTLDAANIPFLWEELHWCGLSKHALFPGIDTAAEHVAWLLQRQNPS